MADEDDDILHVEEVGEQEEEEEVEPEEEVDPRTLLTKEQREEYKKLFDVYDPEKRKYIPTKLIGYILREMGLNPRQFEIKKLADEVDPSNFGRIDFECFLLIMCRTMDYVADTEEDIVKAFQVFDPEETCYLLADEIRLHLTTKGEELEYAEIEELIKQADKLKNGNINYVDFVHRFFYVKKPKKGKKNKGDKKGKKKK